MLILFARLLSVPVLHPSGILPHGAEAQAEWSGTEAFSLNISQSSEP